MKALVGIFNKEKFLALQGSVVSPLTFQWDSPVLLCWVPFTPLGWCIRCHVSYISHNIYLRNLKSCKSLQNAMSNINLAFYNIWGLEHWSSLFIAPPWQIRHTNQKMENFPHFTWKFWSLSALLLGWILRILSCPTQLFVSVNKVSSPRSDPSPCSSHLCVASPDLL